MSRQLIYEINGIKYVLISFPITSEYNRQKAVDRMKKHGGILQQAIPNLGFWKQYVMCDVLIPEDKLFDFNAEGLR